MLQTKLAALDGKGIIDAYVKLAEFIAPKLQRTALAAEATNEPIEITLNLGHLTPEENEAAWLNNERAATRRLSRPEDK